MFTATGRVLYDLLALSDIMLAALFCFRLKDISVVQCYAPARNCGIEEAETFVAMGGLNATFRFLNT